MICKLAGYNVIFWIFRKLAGYIMIYMDILYVSLYLDFEIPDNLIDYSLRDNSCWLFKLVVGYF